MQKKTSMNVGDGLEVGSENETDEDNEDDYIDVLPVVT